MTAERIDEISRYANVCYNRGLAYVQSSADGFNDFVQDMLYYGCKYPNAPLALLLRSVYNEKRKYKEELCFQSGNMITFSTLSEGKENPYEFLERKLGGKEESYFCDSEGESLREVACLLFEKEEIQEDFMNFLYGQVVAVKSRRTQFRKKCFEHRFEILKILHKNERISDREYRLLVEMAKGMEKVATVKKVLKDNYQARWAREKYHKDIEKARAVCREKDKKRKQARQADSEQSKGDI